jgi:hypothetical protein
MSPPLQGLNPLNPIVPRPTQTAKLRLPKSWLQICQVTVAAGLLNDSFEHFQIDIPSTDGRDHFLSFELLFSFEETPNGQGS